MKEGTQEFLKRLSVDGFQFKNLGFDDDKIQRMLRENGFQQKDDWKNMKSLARNRLLLDSNKISGDRENFTRTKYLSQKNQSLKSSLAVSCAFDYDYIAKVCDWILENQSLFEGKNDVLIIGCENGIFSCFLKKCLPDLNIVSVDQCESNIKMAQELASKLGLPLDFQTVTLDDKDTIGNFDVVISLRVLNANVFNLPEPQIYQLLEHGANEFKEKCSGYADYLKKHTRENGILVSLEEIEKPAFMLGWVYALLLEEQGKECAFRIPAKETFKSQIFSFSMLGQGNVTKCEKGFPLLVLQRGKKHNLKKEINFFFYILKAKQDIDYNERFGMHVVNEFAQMELLNLHNEFLGGIYTKDRDGNVWHKIAFWRHNLYNNLFLYEFSKARDNDSVKYGYNYAFYQMGDKQFFDFLNNPREFADDIKSFFNQHSNSKLHLYKFNFSEGREDVANQEITVNDETLIELSSSIKNKIKYKKNLKSFLGYDKENNLILKHAVWLNSEDENTLCVQKYDDEARGDIDIVPKDAFDMDEFCKNAKAKIAEMKTQKEMRVIEVGFEGEEAKTAEMKKTKGPDVIEVGLDGTKANTLNETISSLAESINKLKERIENLTQVQSTSSPQNPTQVKIVEPSIETIQQTLSGIKNTLETLSGGKDNLDNLAKAISNLKPPEKQDVQHSNDSLKPLCDKLDELILAIMELTPKEKTLEKSVEKNDSQPQEFKYPDFKKDLPKDKNNQPNEYTSEKEFFDTFVKYTQSKGLNYTKDDLRRFHNSVKCGYLTILGGPSGFGKSSLAKLYGDCLAGKKNDEVYGTLMVHVSPSWVDKNDILGYVNTINNDFIPSETRLYNRLLLAEEANKDKKNGLFPICLDEMNLSQVEHYFSDFLQVLEMEEKILPCFSKEAVSKNSQFSKHSSVQINDNIRFIGTVNFDETTRTISQRTLDRANLIYLLDTEGEKDKQKKESGKNGQNKESLTQYVSAEKYNSWKKEADEKLKKTIDNLFFPNDTSGQNNEKNIEKMLKGMGIYLSPRTKKAMYTYIASELELLRQPSQKPQKDDKELITIAFDEFVAQRLLSKIRVDNFSFQQTPLKDLNIFAESNGLSLCQKILAQLINECSRISNYQDLNNR